MLQAFGVITLQSDDINNVTLKGGNWTFTMPSIKKVIDVCAKQSPPLPFVFYSDARSSTSKPYRNDYEYIDEIEMVCKQNPKVKCLWCGAGVFMRGLWADPPYLPIVKQLVNDYPNLYISLTPQLVAGQYKGITREDALKLAEELPGRVVLGTMVRGTFAEPPPAEFGEMSYEEECMHLKKFADQIETRCGPGVAAFLRYKTACTVYNIAPPSDPAATLPKKAAEDRGKGLKSLLAKEQSVNTKEKTATSFIASLAYGGSGGSATVCPPSISEKKWDTIDCHLHLLDFLQKSSGTVRQRSSSLRGG